MCRCLSDEGTGVWNYDTLVARHGANAKIYPLPGYEMTSPDW
jgi:hypothetical protein